MISDVLRSENRMAQTRPERRGFGADAPRRCTLTRGRNSSAFWASCLRVWIGKSGSRGSGREGGRSGSDSYQIRFHNKRERESAAACRRRAQRRERSDREEILLQFANFEANKPNSTDCADSFEMHLQRDSGHNIALPAFLPTSRTSSVLFY